jgi:hypothetical protein
MAGEPGRPAVKDARVRFPVFLLACLLGFLVVQPGAEQGEHSFSSGERLEYIVKWEFITGGTACMNISRDSTDPSRLCIEARARSTGIVDMFFTVRDTFRSIVEARTLLPWRFDRRQHEGNYHRDSTYIFDQERQLVRSNGNVIPTGGPVHDMLSIVYRVRTLPLVVGRSVSAEVYEGGKVYPTEVKVLQRERVTVHAGEFDCLVTEPVLRSEALFKQKGKIWIWFTDDSLRIPVLMKSAVAVGEISVELISLPEDTSAWLQSSSH